MGHREITISCSVQEHNQGYRVKENSKLVKGSPIMGVLAQVNKGANQGIFQVQGVNHRMQGRGGNHGV